MVLLAVVMMTLQAGWPWVGDGPKDAHRFQGERPIVVDGRWNGLSTHVRLTQGVVAKCSAAGWLNGPVADRQDRCTRLVKV